MTEPLRSIDLDPQDWRWATWRPWQPLPRPAPAPFDRQRALERLARVPVTRHGARCLWQWAELSLPLSLTREEAHFWFRAMTLCGQHGSPKELAGVLALEPSTGAIDLEVARCDIRSSDCIFTPEIVLPLAILLRWDELMDLMLEPEKIKSLHASHHGGDPPFLPHAVNGFHTYVQPYLSPADRDALCRRISSFLDPRGWPTSYYNRPPPEFHLAASLGCGVALLPLVESWENDRYGAEEWRDYYHRPQEIVFGLDDPSLVEAHMRRLRLCLKEPAYIRAWLAHTEYSALDWVASSILAIQNKETAAALLETLALVKAPEAAPCMLELMLQSKAPRVARQWLEEHPDHAIAGLVPLAAGHGRLAEASADYLRSRKRKGDGAAIRCRLEAAPPEIAGRVRAAVLETVEERLPPFDEETTPEWLREATADLSSLRRAKTPAWIDRADLPPLVLGQQRLNEQQVEALLGALPSIESTQAMPFWAKLKQAADRIGLDTFVWRLFEQWLSEGAPAKEHWVMRALGCLGSDTIALKLTPLIRAWPGESQHQRAVLGLECLRAIGTDTALMQINGIAQKVKFKGLKAKALECMEVIAAERGLTRAELEDRIVPDCDLDERGSYTFDFGPRQFRLVLGPDLKPMIREQERSDARGGKLRPDLPKPTTKDNPAPASAAIAAWKLLKKQVADVAKIQAGRLEQAMVTGRQWARSDFETLLVRHPLMTHLVRRLVWAGRDQAGALVATFRITEDRTYAGAADETFNLDAINTVEIVHPLHLPPELGSQWGELLSDYEIVPPFPQLGRPIYALEAAQANKTEVTGFAHVKIPALSLIGTLERLGWVRGIPQDAGWFYEHSKPFYGAQITAIVQYDGMPVGYREGWVDQTISRSFFVPGIYHPIIYPQHSAPIPLGQIDPVVLSEVLADLTAITAKGK